MHQPPLPGSGDKERASHVFKDTGPVATKLWPQFLQITLNLESECLVQMVLPFPSCVTWGKSLNLHEYWPFGRNQMRKCP